jgi:hypothetical protein
MLTFDFLIKCQNILKIHFRHTLDLFCINNEQLGADDVFTS